ncbi:uncharacterized protein [Macaca nemestrina]|uniref:uncharacterized protein isoform X3 n=1 Tax=Macaca nemestrina TaxID=9545 RepID=UPI0039B89E13
MDRTHFFPRWLPPCLYASRNTIRFGENKKPTTQKDGILQLKTSPRMSLWPPLLPGTQFGTETLRLKSLFIYVWNGNTDDQQNKKGAQTQK